ncbi:hypothetical protein FRACYDRAFT_238155 [Fragilariopsis cylindrus CCMP1102]|uniref:C3H1-type domain-containing protein n=1 Tax=Fragilariopsis cylindrus CCMP1102 TaxID=635003 RepID=A0A1E7FHU1_9STRA|nr:hypothetical protein FRACYDRAFT_238155 [Fragilariopsis cylindrus CCMP1102]|eukprot:OEU17728.1 hypothetical protein FRACYDRAFT_238155 [Fragilariopsis cylindrus CCMP1102]
MNNNTTTTNGIVNINNSNDSNNFRMIEKVQFRFIDPLLSVKYSSDALGYSLFTTINNSGGGDDSRDDTSSISISSTSTTTSTTQTTTIVVPHDIIERLRQSLLTIMLFECTDNNGYEKRYVIPHLVSNATFYYYTDSCVALQLQTPEDVQQILIGIPPGSNLKIWIETTKVVVPEPSIDTRVVTVPTIAPPLPPPPVPTTDDDHLQRSYDMKAIKHPQKNSSSKPCRFFFRQGRSCQFGENCRFSHVPLEERLCRFFFQQGSCQFGENCPFSHVLLEEMGQNNQQQEHSRIKKTQSAANSGRHDNQDGGYDYYFNRVEHFGFLAGLFICDDDNKDLDHTTKDHSAHDRNENSGSSSSLSSLLSLSLDTKEMKTNSNNNSTAVENTTMTTITQQYLMPSFFDATSTTTTTTTTTSTSMSSSYFNSNSKPFALEFSSSLFQGPEREMVMILESVLNNIVVSDDNNDEDQDVNVDITNHHHHFIANANANANTDHDEGDRSNNNDNDRRKQRRYQQLLAMDWKETTALISSSSLF